MKKADLSYEYPAHLVATETKPISRVMYVQGAQPIEVTTSFVLTQIQPGDVLVVNETKVIPARVFSEEGLEVLFIENVEKDLWHVLCPARRWPKGKNLHLPGGVELELVETGLPQVVRAHGPMNVEYLVEHGDMPLPPYIQEARGERRSRDHDQSMYQTDWAETLGSLAAPTASLHFSKEDLLRIRTRGAEVKSLTLHVGLGTFLPIHADNLEDHKMHSEFVSIPEDTWQACQEAKASGGKVWALGSTVTRALESKALREEFDFNTDLFIKPGFDWKVVDVLMTNFHQPESTLLAMVMAFAGVENTRSMYNWAIAHNFRLFSYGDLSVWRK